MRFRSGSSEPSARFHIVTATSAAAAPQLSSAPQAVQLEEARADEQAGTWFDSSIELRAGLDVYELPAGSATFRTSS